MLRLSLAVLTLIASSAPYAVAQAAPDCPGGQLSYYDDMTGDARCFPSVTVIGSPNCAVNVFPDGDFNWTGESYLIWCKWEKAGSLSLAAGASIHDFSTIMWTTGTYPCASSTNDFQGGQWSTRLSPQTYFASGQVQMSFLVTFSEVPTSVTETTFGSTATATSTNYVETQYIPSGTVTERPTSTVTATPDVSTVTEIKTEEVDLGPDYYAIYVDAGTSTAATETVQATTTLTDIPSAVTTTATVTPATTTVYETSWATSTPPTKTVTSVQTVQTGNADCTNFRLVFPADCCPNQYVKLKSLHRRAIDLEKRAIVTVDGGVTTSTRTVDATKTLPSGQATVTSFVTETKTAEVPLTTTTTTTTETLPQPQIGYTVSEYDEVVTPYETVFHTVRETAATPTQVVSVTGAQPVSTIKVMSTTTLAQPVTTTVSTAYAQATTCAVKTVYTQSSCPSSKLVKTLVQDAQVATLNLYKALGGKSVVVDCGAEGAFSY
ncbi:hypothetical protein JCM8097_002995 [Rhodosporidiobolus ruineniae]